MLKSSKKGLSIGFLTALILAIVTLIFILVKAYGMLDDADYEGSLLNCNLLFNSMQGKPDFFGDGLDSPTEKFKKLVASTCPFKDFEISKSSYKNAAQLTKDCWFKGAQGSDILGANVENFGICVYCGQLTSEEDMDFRKGFLEEIGKDEYKSMFEQDSSSLNANAAYLLGESPENPEEKDLSPIPDRIGAGNAVGVFYYIYKPKIDCNEIETDEKGKQTKNTINFANCGDGIQRTASRYLGSLLPTLNYLASSSSEDSVAGVILATMTEDEESEFSGENIKFANNAIMDSCYFVWTRDIEKTEN